MSQGVKVFLILFIANFCVVAVYVIGNHMRNKEKKLGIWLNALVMALCPVVGPAFFLVSFLLHKFLLGNVLDLSDVAFSKERVETVEHPDEEVEKNMVSLEEALEVTDKKNLRALIMNVIRGDYRNSLSSISLALNSEDSETAHYAASILQDVLNEFRASIHAQYRALDEAQEGLTERCIQLIEYMNPIVEQRVLTDLEQRSMSERMAEVLEKAWNAEPVKISSVVYEKVCQRLLETENYEECQKWCVRLMEQYPGTLASYTCQLKLYFSCQDRENFFRVMQELRESEITIDNETLELIRIFM